MQAQMINGNRRRNITRFWKTKTINGDAMEGWAILYFKPLFLII